MVVRETQPGWAVKVLGPMLVDKHTGCMGSFSIHEDKMKPRNRVRLCNSAAENISQDSPGIHFNLVGEYEDVDRQIAEIQRRVAPIPP